MEFYRSVLNFNCIFFFFRSRVFQVSPNKTQLFAFQDFSSFFQQSF